MDCKSIPRVACLWPMKLLRSTTRSVGRALHTWKICMEEDITTKANQMKKKKTSRRESASDENLMVFSRRRLTVSTMSSG